MSAPVRPAVEVGPTSRFKFSRLASCGFRCKPQVLSPEAVSANSNVSVLAGNMLERGWITRDEYTQLLLGDRLHSLQEAALQEQERQRRRRERRRTGLGIRQKLSGQQSRVGGIAIAQRARERRKTTTRNKSIGSEHPPSKVAKAAITGDKTKSVQQRHTNPCRDPITLDDLGSWTWDFRACEAATPPVSCGGTADLWAKKHGGGEKGKGVGGGGRGIRGGGGGDGGSEGRDGGSSRSSSVSSSSSAVVTYNVESLVLYLLESGDFQEPTTRRPFSLVQLADLDALAAKAGAKVKGSLVTSYHEGKEKYRERRERREMLVGADRCLGDIVSEMLTTIEDTNESHEEAHIYLCTLFPQFAHIYSQIKEADEEFARQCLAQQIALLRGPPNRPTASSLSSDQGALLRAAVEFLSEQGGSGTVAGTRNGEEGTSTGDGGVEDVEDGHGGGDHGGGDHGGVRIGVDGATLVRGRNDHENQQDGGIDGESSSGEVEDRAVASLLSEVAAAAAAAAGGELDTTSGSDDDGDDDDDDDDDDDNDDDSDEDDYEVGM